MATIQKVVVDSIIEPKLDLIDRIRGETFQEIAIYLKNRNIHFDYLPDFLINPHSYPGKKNIGLRQISEKFLQDVVSKYYFKIQAQGLPIKYVINTIRENLFQGGWNIKRYTNITMATRGGDDARKAVSTSRIDEPPRLLIVKNKDHKVRSKLNSNIISKKKRKPYKKGRTYKKGKKGSCGYCGANAKHKATRNTTHINISQNPTHHYFCSKECKISWIFVLNKKISQEA